jgi:hypothetical protein
MHRLLLISLIIWSLNSFSQEFKSEISNQAFLFTYRDQSYVISGDSIFSNPKGSGWVGSKHNLVINDFAFFQDNSSGYLMNNSGGIVYKFDGVNFVRLDESFNLHNQYQSFPFRYKGSIYNFGGYGLFTFKNIITFFDESKKETELVKVKTPISKNPFGRKLMFAQLEGDELYIGSGFGYDNDIADGYKNVKVFEDYWVFDLISKEWKKLGNGRTLVVPEMYSLIYDFNGKTLVLTLTAEKIFTIDIKNNKIDYYGNANLDLLKSTHKDVVRNLITYNKHKNGFYLVKGKPNYPNKLVFVSSDIFLGKPTRSENLYSKEHNSSIFYGLFALLFSVSIFFVSKKKNIFKKISSKREEINLTLNEEESQIFNLIFEKYPDYLPFPELIDVFENHLNYENRKKKLRLALYQIEDKIKGVLKTKGIIFVERKNKEDLRIKEIKIK